MHVAPCMHACMAITTLRYGTCYHTHDSVRESITKSLAIRAWREINLDVIRSNTAAWFCITTPVEI